MNRIVSLSSRKAYGFSLLLGALAALSFPPLHIIITPFIAFPLWLYLLEVNQEKSWKKHFAMGWWFGLGYFTVGLYWITFALGVDIGLFWWLVPFALFGIPTGLGVYLGCMTVLLKLTRSTGLARCFWFAALWTSAELAWGSGPLALPWNPLGVIWSGFEPILQSVSVIGIYGLTLMTALFVSFPILFRKDFFKAKQIIYVSSLAVIFIGATTWGMERPSNTPVQQKDHQPLVRIVQPYIPQDLNWEPAKAREQFHDLVQLSATKAETQPDIWIWPESALPLLLDEDQARIYPRGKGQDLQ
jgi:apolipoprotein N-acyltransferase